jgi:hypothetical protein
MKKSLFRLAGFLFLLTLFVSVLTVGASAADGEGSASLVDRFVKPVYEWFEETFESLFTYVRNCIPALKTLSPEWIHYVILAAVLLVVLAFAIWLIISIFKLRFFRSLSLTGIVLLILGCGSFIGLCISMVNDGLAVKSFDDACALVHLTLMTNAPKFYEATVMKIEILQDPLWVLPIVMIVLAVLLAALFLVVISFSKKLERKRCCAKTEGAIAPLAAPAEVVAIEAAPETEEAPAEEVAEEAAAEEEPEAEAEPETEAEPEAEAEPEEEAPTYPMLDEPVFMPIPSSVFDAVDFTEPKRDGYALTVNIKAEETAEYMSDELAEELTATVYRRIPGEVAEIGLDCLNANFEPYAYIDARILRRLGLISESAAKIRVLGVGKMDKPLMIEASEIELDAVKMVTLAGGRVIRIL